MLALVDHSFVEITGHTWERFRDDNFPNEEKQPNLHNFFQAIRLENPVALPDPEHQAAADRVRNDRLSQRG